MLALLLMGSVMVKEVSGYEYISGASARVKHPATTLKPADLNRAKQNIAQHEWAKQYAEAARSRAQSAAAKVTPEWLLGMVPVTTPGDTLFTPCPACREQKKPVHSHGFWDWSADKPDQLTCKKCGTVFPHEKYPESIVLKTKWGGEQTLSFCGGPTFVVFGWSAGRPSFTGNIRACKVQYVRRLLDNLTVGYALTNDESFASAARLILLRFAETYPRWLVHSGYGDYADMDPKTAAANINNLPEPTLVYPPNKPSRKLFTGYWSAGRSSGVGMEQGFVMTCVEAYDLTYDATVGGKPLFSAEDRIKIERDLLFEGASMLWPDPGLNNKSVGGRMACLLVGLCLGNPDLVRLGWNGFVQTVDDWFLDDGATSESPGYASMTLGGIWPIAEAMKGYSDPPGYQPKDGKRIENLDPYHDTRYPLVWRAMFNTLQGNLKYPPIEDSYRTSDLGALYLELMVANYDDPNYLAMLTEIAGDDLSRGYLAKAIFLRDPDLAKRAALPLSFGDVVFPELRWGVVRSGECGRDSFLCLNADEFRGHHHYDSLDLYYWKDNHELLSDLGYLWDHPDKVMTYRTAAHNLVVIDNREQAGHNERGGQIHLFSPGDDFKVMEASSIAYAEAAVYRRTVMQVDHGNGRNYVADIFRASGGQQRDYLFHGPGNDYQVEGITLSPAKETAPQIPFAVRIHLDRVGQVWVDDAEVRVVDENGNPGENLIASPSATELGASGFPTGWGHYSGDGERECGAAKPGRTDDACVTLNCIAPGKEHGVVNQAIILGDSDGYKGDRAPRVPEGSKVKVSFWIRGTMDVANVELVHWSDKATTANERRYLPVTMASGSPLIPITQDWLKIEGTFVLGKSSDIRNLKSGDGTQPWKIKWKLPDNYSFTAWSPGTAGEQVLVGDGWGQRDYQNTDVGATLPYITRRLTGAPPSQFISIFEGSKPGAECVRVVRTLKVTGDPTAFPVALEVQGEGFTDVLFSALDAKPAVVETSAGNLKVNGLAARVMLRDGKVTGGSLIGGTSLKIGDFSIASPVAVYRGEVKGQKSAKDDGYYEITGELPAIPAAAHQTLFVDDGKQRRAFPILSTEKTPRGARVHVKSAHAGYDPLPGKTWEVVARVDVVQSR